jgi:hypothetical protein
MWGDGDAGDMTGRSVLAGGLWMAWVLRLVETGIDGPARVIDVMDITPFGALGDISNLGLMLSEAKQILARLQQAVVAIQADDHAVRRPACSGCGKACHVKDRRLHRAATLCLARWRCTSRDFAAPAVVMVRRVSAGCRIADPRLNSTSYEPMFLL